MHQLELRYKKCSFYVLPAIGCRCGSTSNTFFLLTHNCVVSMHCATHSTLAKTAYCNLGNGKQNENL